MGGSKADKENGTNKQEDNNTSHEVAQKEQNAHEYEETELSKDEKTVNGGEAAKNAKRRLSVDASPKDTERESPNNPKKKNVTEKAIENNNSSNTIVSEEATVSSTTTIPSFGRTFGATYHSLNEKYGTSSKFANLQSMYTKLNTTSVDEATKKDESSAPFGESAPLFGSGTTLGGDAKLPKIDIFAKPPVTNENDASGTTPFGENSRLFGSGTSLGGEVKLPTVDIFAKSSTDNKESLPFGGSSSLFGSSTSLGSDIKLPKVDLFARSSDDAEKKEESTNDDISETSTSVAITEKKETVNAKDSNDSNGKSGLSALFEPYKSVSGEEDEATLYEIDGKLFVYNRDDRAWAERGFGALKLLQSKANEGDYRLVMRHGKTKKVILNSKVFRDMNPQGAEFRLDFLAADDGKVSSYAFKTKANEKLNVLIGKLKDAITSFQKE
ncbi:hypothetical protein K502DRAFT_326777 [Neoconidiobolus thromboides FSU 785]|nr:hypothetical protein K502DRAFT_326777 [Neoconidiobolus thromboides FSU 785]